MKNKLLSAVLAVLIAAGGTVCFASSDGEVTAGVLQVSESKYTGSSIIISGNIGSAEERTLTFKAVVPGEDASRLENVYRMNEIRSDSNGNFSIEVIPEDYDAEGEYIYYVGGRGFDTASEGSFYYFPVDKKEAFISELNEKTSSDEVLDYFSKNQLIMKTMGCVTEQYNSLDNEYKEKIGVKFAGYDDITLETFLPSYNKMVALQTLEKFGGGSNIYEVFMSNAGLLEINVGEGSNTYWLGKERTFKVLQDMFKDKIYDAPEDFIKSYEDSALTAVFNHALWGEMEDVLKINEEALGIDLNLGKYESKKDELYKALADQTYSVPNDVIKAYNAAKKDLENENKDSDNNSHKGSGGGGGGGNPDRGSVTIPVAQAGNNNPQPEKEPEREFESSIKDLDGASWAEEFVVYLEEKGIVSGDENKNFNPNQYITREQFVSMLAIAFGFSDESANSMFEDVQPDAWYRASVAGAFNAGIVSGLEDGKFGTGQTITRQDMSAMLYRAVVKLEISLPKTRELTDFGDKNDISDYASESIEYLYTRGVINGMGDGTFAPKANATKAQAAVMLCSVLKGSEEENK